MAIIILSTPQRLTPAYNPVIFTFSGSNFSRTNFKYLVDVYDASNNQLIVRQTIPKQPDNTGKVDLSRILNNLLEVDAPLSATSTNITTQSKLDYYIQIGEESSPDAWNFTNVIWSANTYITLSSTTTNHPYVKFNNILITNTSSGATPLLGSATVESSASTRSITLFWKANFNPFGVINTGTTTLEGGGTNQIRNVVGASGFTVFNGVQKFEDFRVWSGANFTLTGTSITKQALTSQPATNFYATPTQDIILNYYISGATGDTYAIRYTTDTAFIQNTVAITGNGTNQLIQFKVGPGNLTMPANTIYYDVVLFKNLVTQLTKPYRIYLDRRCKINDFEIAFMDRMGSISSFNFQLRSTENGTVNRVQYKKQVPDTYQSYDRGNTNININFDKIFTMNTNFMTEEMSIYFEELITSPYTWVKMNGQYLACTIEENSFEVVHQKNKRLIQYTIKIKLANSNNINI